MKKKVLCVKNLRMMKPNPQHPSTNKLSTTDIGLFLKNIKTTNDNDKYMILNNHWKPIKTISFRHLPT